MNRGIAPGCHRLTTDYPDPLYELMQERAATPPKIPVSEYVRRLVAHHLNYPLPPIAERRIRKLRINGTRRETPGPKTGRSR